MIVAVCSAALSVIFHSRYHFLAETLLYFVAVFSSFAFLKVLNTFSSLFPRRIEMFVHWIHAMTFELFALLGVLVVKLFRFSKNFQKPVGALSGRPILLIHGYCNDGSVWTYLKKQLAKEGLGPLYTIDLGHPFRSIRDYVLKVKEKVAQIQGETNRSDLVLIGHSMGGLVGSLYTTNMAVANTVTDVITIGSPLGGTHVAKLGIGPNAKEMQRSSELIKELHQNIAKEKLVRFYHIGSNTDQMIIPSHSALLNQHLSREFIFEDIGHVSMLFSPRIAQLITHWIRISETKELGTEIA